MFDIVQTSKEQIEASCKNTLGSGCFADVYEHTVPGLVVKKVRKLERDGWVFYALWSMTQGYSWLPKIHYIHIDFSAGVLYAVMEKLVSQDDNSMKNVGYISYYGTKYEPVEKIVPGFKDFIKFMSSWLTFDEDYGIDAHDGNFMRRKNFELVLTDPITTKTSDYVSYIMKEFVKDMMKKHNNFDGKVVIE